MIDIHAHLNDDKLYENVEEIIQQALKAGVNKIVCSSYDLPSSEKAFLLCERFENVYANIGMHPHDSKLYDDSFEKMMCKFAKNQKVIAYGEIGLDYHYDLSPREIQKQIFEKQLDVANKLNLPIVVHTREATNDTINILKANINKLNNRGMIHCFNGSFETFKQYYEMGFIISIGGAITFNNAKNLIELLPMLPKDSYCFETDCPYLTPVPFRGQINVPENVKYVYKKAAEVLNEDLQEIILRARCNVKGVFDI